MNIDQKLKALTEWNTMAFGHIIKYLDEFPVNVKNQIFKEICRHGLLHNREIRATLEEIKLVPGDDEAQGWEADKFGAVHPQIERPVDEGAQKDIEELKRMISVEGPEPSKIDIEWYQAWLKNNKIKESGL